jgi:hypothetical protein
MFRTYSKCVILIISSPSSSSIPLRLQTAEEKELQLLQKRELEAKVKRAELENRKLELEITKEEEALKMHRS